MKINFALTLFYCLINPLLNFGEDLSITLKFWGVKNFSSVNLNSITIINLDRNCDTTVFYPKNSISLSVLGVEEKNIQSESLTVYQPYPNPISNEATIKIYQPKTEQLNIYISDLSGKIVSHFEGGLSTGYHYFKFYPKNKGYYFIKISTPTTNKNIKIISCKTSRNEQNSIEYIGKEEIMNKNIKHINKFIFALNDHFRLIGRHEIDSVVLDDTPQSSKNYTFYFDSSGFVCGQHLQVHHVAEEVAPVNKITSYGTVKNIPGEQNKCWITSNLGSDRIANSANDTSENSAGWYWQFNRKQGYRHDGKNRTPNTVWITNKNENSDWLLENDPCRLEINSHWRIPSFTELYNISSAGGWQNYNDAWASDLVFHAAGELISIEGLLQSRGIVGLFWTSSQHAGMIDRGWYLMINSGYCFILNLDKSEAKSIRCLSSDF